MMPQQNCCFCCLPSQIPDLDSVELLWFDLKRSVHSRHPRRMKMKPFYWRNGPKTPSNCCASLISNFRNRLRETVQAPNL